MTFTTRRLTDEVAERLRKLIDDRGLEAGM